MDAVSADGTRVRYSKVGSGPATVFIHGGWPGLQTRIDPVDLATMEPWERTLAAQRTLVRFARRGYAPSSCAATGYEIPNQALDVVTVLDAANLDCVHVIASSSGGPVGCALAALHPDRVASLVLAGTGPDLRTTLAPRPKLLAALETLIDDLNRLGAEEAALRRRREIAVSIDPLFMQDEYTARGDGELYDERLQGWDERSSAIDPRERAQWLAAEVRAVEAYLAWTGLAAAEQISSPTLVLHGGDDRAILASEGAALAHAIPNARLIVYHDEPHSLLWRHPPALAEAMAFQSQFS